MSNKLRQRLISKLCKMTKPVERRPSLNEYQLIPMTVIITESIVM